MAATTDSGKYILILKAIQEPKLRYVTAKKLAELWPSTPFVQWKAKVDAGGTIVLTRAESFADLNKFKKELDAIQAPCDVVEQKSIGGKRVF